MHMYTYSYILRRNITPSIIVLSFIAHVQLKMVVLSEESGSEAKLVLKGFSPRK